MKQGSVAGVIFHQRITKLIHDDEIGAVDRYLSRYFKKIG